MGKGIMFDLNETNPNGYADSSKLVCKKKENTKNKYILGRIFDLGARKGGAIIN